jgi:hypothetical protein
MDTAQQFLLNLRDVSWSILFLIMIISSLVGIIVLPKVLLWGIDKIRSYYEN